MGSGTARHKREPINHRGAVGWPFDIKGWRSQLSTLWIDDSLGHRPPYPDACRPLTHASAARAGGALDARGRGPAASAGLRGRDGLLQLVQEPVQTEVLNAWKNLHLHG
jgi:hypothetical protein